MQVSLLLVAREASDARAKITHVPTSAPVSELVAACVAWNLRVAMWLGDC